MNARGEPPSLRIVLSFHILIKVYIHVYTYIKSCASICYMLLFKLTEKLDEYKVPYCIVGGLAVALHGYVRVTMDIDIVIQISDKNFELCEKVLKDLGFESKIPVTAKEISKFRKEYIEKRNLIAWSFYNKKNPFEVVDILLTHDQKKLDVEKIEIYGKKISLVSKKDLIKMKQESGRPQDLIDIEELKKKK